MGATGRYNGIVRGLYPCAPQRLPNVCLVSVKPDIVAGEVYMYGINPATKVDQASLEGEPARDGTRVIITFNLGLPK